MEGSHCHMKSWKVDRSVGSVNGGVSAGWFWLGSDVGMSCDFELPAFGDVVKSNGVPGELGDVSKVYLAVFLISIGGANELFHFMHQVIVKPAMFRKLDSPCNGPHAAWSPLWHGCTVSLGGTHD